MSVSTDTFRPAWWLSNPHAQTIWQTLFRRRLDVILRRERIVLSDGDFVDLDWTPKVDAPIVLIIHGMEGSSSSPYARGMQRALHASGYNSVVMNLRGCGGSSNRLLRRYHAGDTQDLAEVVSQIGRRHPETPIYGVGYSLGGNMMLKWSGETAEANPLSGVIAISVPFDLDRVAERLTRGASRLYQRYLLVRLKRAMKEKAEHPDFPVNTAQFRRIAALREFDDSVTAPLHGFLDASDYYQRASCKPFLKSIRKPCLIVHAKDDPFMDADVIPDESEISACTELLCSERGGHVGFISGPVPFRPKYWLEDRVVRWLNGLQWGSC